MIIHNVGQRSSEWFKLRLGKITGSNAHKLLTKTKFKTYYYQLLAETITRVITEGHLSDAMQWGIDNEPFAAEWYEEQTGYDVSVCGFIEDENNIFGCSPDLLVGDIGMAQIKCPGSKTHLEYKINGPDDEAIYQMQWEMFVAERQWNDFISYDPRFKGKLVGHIKRIERDDSIIKKLETAAKDMQEQIQMFLFDNDIQVSRYVPIKPPEFNEADLAMYLRT